MSNFKSQICNLNFGQTTSGEVVIFPFYLLMRKSTICLNLIVWQIVLQLKELQLTFYFSKKNYIYIYISFSNYKNFIVNEYFNLKLICNVYIIVQTTSPIRGHKSHDELEYIKLAQTTTFNPTIVQFHYLKLGNVNEYPKDILNKIGLQLFKNSLLTIALRALINMTL